MIRIVTDSAAMLPDELRHRYSITVVPLTITVDGCEYTEGTDLTTADFYASLAAGAEVSTAAPAPGAFVDAYRAAASEGATALLSVHTGSTLSATVSSATLAAGLVDIPVTLIDTGVASFPVAMAVWSAAESIADGGSVDDAARIARATAERVGSLFVVGVSEVARRGGRFVSVNGELTPTTVLELVSGRLTELGMAADIDAAIEMMVEHTVRLADDEPLRIGVGHGAHQSVAEVLVARLADVPGIVDITLYEVGPSVGAHTGPGTFGVVYAPSEPASD